MKRISKIKFFLLISLFLLLFFPGFGTGSPAGLKENSKENYHEIPAVTSKVKIDGILDDQAWNDALVLTLNYEVEPGENITPQVKTEIFLIYSEDCLYAAFKAYDPEPSAIRARYSDRDHIQDDDYVGIVLDTFDDSRRTYNFYCNPYGIQADKVVSLGDEDDRWDVIWDSMGRITKEGYMVEMAIPFSSLRFQRKKEEQMWGIDAVRNYPRSLTHFNGLFPRDRNNNCYMCQADKLTGLRGISPGKNIEFDPTLSALLTQERQNFPDGKFSPGPFNLIGIEFWTQIIKLTN